MFSGCETSNAFIDAFCYFHQSGPLKLIKTMLKSLHVLVGLSLVWNHYPKGSRTKGATKFSITAFNEIKDRICKEYRSVPKIIYPCNVAK